MGFLVLSARLIELQIIRGSYFRSLAEGNRIRRVPIAAPRGNILARGGEILVSNKEVKKRVIFDPESGYKKVDDIKNASFDELITEWARDYELGPAFAHVSGYLGEASEEEVGKIKGECPEKGPRKLGSLLGRMGLEEGYNCILSGIDGEELVEVDAKGAKIRVLGSKNPIAGSDIKTSIDFGLQKKVAELMEGKSGAVVVSDEKGEVLALYSSPSFDPNIFVSGKNQDSVIALLNDKNLPLFNRAISGSFHPGSVFKPFVAIAALEEGKIDEGFTFTDPGVIRVGTYTFANWYFTQYGKTEGTINLPHAITRSTDTFFYKIGELAGPEAIANWAHKLGLGDKTEIDLPGEVSGLIPTPEWKLRVKGERWFLGNTYHMSIGQGDIALTPIAVNRAISAIANGGKLCKPRIVSSQESGNDKFQIPNDKCEELNIDKGYLDLVKEGMVGACSPGGTGFTFFDFPTKSPNQTQVACKTGTAETEEEGKTHAWFVAFGPVDSLGEGEISVAVLVEKGGEGAYVAGPIARKIFDYWFGVAETRGSSGNETG